MITGTSPPEQAEIERAQRRLYGRRGAAVRWEKWDDYLMTYENHDRAWGFLNISFRLIRAARNGDEEAQAFYWRTLGWVWQMNECSLGEFGHEVWQRWFSQPFPGREHLMDDDEVGRAVLDALPPLIGVWRGFHFPGGEAGLAWTQNRTMAEGFAWRLAGVHGRRAFLAEATVPREQVIAAFWDRSEEELVILDVPNPVVSELDRGSA